MNRILSDEITLLFVDDDAIISQAFKAYIEVRIPKIFVASSGAEALELLEKHSPGIVLTDINMPGMDGIELCKEIKAKNPDTYVTAVTAHSDMDYFLEAFDAGFDNYLMKPIVPERLEEILQRAIQKEELKKTVLQQREALEEAYSIAEISSFVCRDANMDEPLEADHFFYVMFGIDDTAITLKEFFSKHIQEEERENFLAKRLECLQKQEPFEFETKMLKADGTPLDVLIIYKPKFDEKGDPVASRAVIKDITSIKADQRRADRHQQELSLLLDTIPDGAWNWNLVEKTLFLTPRWKEMLGFQDHELPNHPDTFFKRLHPNDVPVVDEAIKEHLEKREGYYEACFRLLCKDGSYKWIKARGKAIFDHAGQPYKLLGLHEDIGNALRLEKAEKEVAVYEKIVSSSRDGLLYIDKEHRIRAANESFFKDFYVAKEDVLGKTPEEVYGKEFYEACIKPDLEGSFSGGTVIRSDWYTAPAGKRFKQVAHIPYFEYGTDKVEGVVVNVHDMTDWKQTEDQLLELTNTLETKVKQKVDELREKDSVLMQQGRFAAMGEMLSMIAHQWRQPLNAVSAASINLKLFSEMGSLTPEILEQQCNFIEKQSLQMSQTINDFMSFFRPDKEKKAFALVACIDNVQKMIQAQLKTHSIVLDVSLDKDITLHGVKNEMEHIILNLLSNARDALAEQEESKEKVIELRSVCSRDHAEIIVRDTGGGIPEEIIHKIFDPYFTTKPQGKGTGIGLYMTKIIIEQHFGGELNVVNGEKGAEFRMMIPLQERC